MLLELFTLCTTMHGSYECLAPLALQLNLLMLALASHGFGQTYL